MYSVIYILFYTYICLYYADSYCIDYSTLTIFKKNAQGNDMDTGDVEEFCIINGIEQLTDSEQVLVYRFESYSTSKLVLLKQIMKQSSLNFKSENKVDYDERPYEVRLFNRYPMQYEDIAMYVNDLRNKDFVEILHIGLTEGLRRMDVVKITTKAKEKYNPSIWIDCGIHAREWHSVTACIHFLRYLVETFETTNKEKSFMKNINWYILPVVNIDGYMSSIKTDNMLRKNLNQVDLNRNFPVNWDHKGVTDPKNVSSQQFRGHLPASENEVKNLINFFSNVKTKFQAQLNIHTFSQVIVFPPGSKSNPKEYESMMAVAKKMSDSLYWKKGVDYRFGEIGDILQGEMSGLMMQYMKTKHDVKYPFIIELSPSVAEVVDNMFLLNNMFVFNKKMAESNADNLKILVETLAETVSKEHELSPSTSTSANVQTHIYLYILAIICVYSVLIIKVLRLYSKSETNNEDDVQDDVIAIRSRDLDHTTSTLV